MAIESSTMTEQEFLEYTADPSIAYHMAGIIDVGTWHMTLEEALSELDPKMKEAILYMEENKIPPNWLGYRHLKRPGVPHGL